ncbi:unnamed protein product, partial [marine sediment metagenome]
SLLEQGNGQKGLPERSVKTLTWDITLQGSLMINGKV